MSRIMQLSHPDISLEMVSQIDEILSTHKDASGAVIPALRLCQDVVGYLPLALIDYIARGLNLPSSEVFGVATFYSLFSLKPKGRHTIRACLGTACYVKGISEVLGRVQNTYRVDPGGITADRRFSLETVRCLGACGLAPVLVVDQDTHGGMTADRIVDVLEKYE